MNNLETGPDHQQTKKKIPEIIWISALPVVAYAMSFLYEQGFCNVFHIHKFLIKIDINNMLGYLGGVIIFILPAYFFLDSFKESREKQDYFNMDIVFDLTMFIFFVVASIAMGVKGLWWGIPIAIILYIIFLHYLYPIFRFKEIKGYKNKINQRKAAIEIRHSLAEDAMAKYGRTSVLVIWALFIFLCASMTFGGFNARTRTSYLVVKAYPEIVVLRKYGNRLVCAEFDRKEKTVKREFKILTFDQISERNYKFEKEIIGPLKIEVDQTKK